MQQQILNCKISSKGVIRINQKSVPELDKLFYEVGTYRQSDKFKDLIKFIKKFPRIAPYNAMLIHIQKPGSVYVASASVWRRTFEREIVPGSRPLMILRPFGPVSFVFDLSDTFGNKEFPSELINPFKAKGDISDFYLHRLLENLKSYGIFYREADSGTTSAGWIQMTDSNRKLTITRTKKEITVKTLYNLVVNKNHPQNTKFATILHELGHLYCGHLGVPHDKWWKDRRGLSRNAVEFEAESVCWIICERLGVHNPSAEYLSGYLSKNKEIPSISIDSVLKAAGIIESMMNTQVKPKKEIILE